MGGVLGRSNMHESQESTRFRTQLLGAAPLSAASVDRLLRVTDGRVWITASSKEMGALPSDVWLDAGESYRVAAGVESVIESWPSAKLEILSASAVKSTSRKAPARAMHLVRRAAGAFVRRSLA